MLENANRFSMYGLTFSECPCPVIKPNRYLLVQGEVSILCLKMRYRVLQIKNVYFPLLTVNWLSIQPGLTSSNGESHIARHMGRKAVIGTYIWNLSDSLHVMCVGSSQEGTHQLTGTAHCKRAWVPSVKVLGGVIVIPRVAPKWSDKNTSLMVKRLKYRISSLP